MPRSKGSFGAAWRQYRRYSQDVPAGSGAPDIAFLPEVGRHGWLLITADWHQRKRPRELEDLRRYKVKHFALPGNLGADKMAELLISTKNDIRACARDHKGHVSATIQKDGRVNVLRDDQGPLHERGETKLYYKGKLYISKPH